MRATALRRREQAEQLRKANPLPHALTAYELEEVSAGITIEERESRGDIRGARVSGTRSVEGRACVVSEAEAERGNALDTFHDGDIIVAPMINPAWLPYFSKAGGFVSELGGWLSHTAILAREHDVPMIVRTDGLGKIVNGSLLRLHLDGRVEIIEDTQEAIGEMAAE